MLLLISRKIELFTSKEDTECDQKKRNDRPEAVINYKIILRVAIELIFMLPILLYKSVKNLFKKSKSVNGKICLVSYFLMLKINNNNFISCAKYFTLINHR